MPARSKRSLAALARHADAKKPKLEPDKPPPQSMKRCRFIDCGEAGRVRLAAAARGRDQVHAAARPVRGRLPTVAHRRMWYHQRFVPMQEAAAAQKRAAAEKLYAVHECTNQCAQVGFYNH